jgi:hypothetical protein
MINNQVIGIYYYNIDTNKIFFSAHNALFNNILQINILLASGQENDSKDRFWLTRPKSTTIANLTTTQNQASPLKIPY